MVTLKFYWFTGIFNKMLLGLESSRIYCAIMDDVGGGPHDLIRTIADVC